MSGNELPVEIRKYYQNLNLANAFSTPSERYKLTSYLTRKDSTLAPNSKRQAFVLNLLEEIKQHEYVSEATIPNTFRSGRLPISPMNTIQYWTKGKDLISVRLKVYQLCIEDNLKIINLYDEETDSIKGYDDIEKIAHPVYLTQEVHEWVFLNNQWVKKQVRKVLLTCQILAIAS